MEGSEDEPLSEVLAVKAWLRDLREKAGLTQKELAQAMGVSTRVVLNAEGEDEGLPRGLGFLRMLQELRVVTEAPAPDEPTLRSLLESIEAQVANLATKEELQAGLDVLREAIDSVASQGTRRKKA